jgi:hypothetical protein
MSDRPVECSQCKRPVKVLYKEIFRRCTVNVHGNVRRLPCASGQAPRRGRQNRQKRAATSLLRQRAGPSLESDPDGPARRLYPSVLPIFNDFLVGELIAADAIPHRFAKETRRADGRRSSTSVNPPTSPSTSRSLPASPPSTKPSTTPSNGRTLSKPPGSGTKSKPSRKNKQ